ncbi:metalloprotein [Deinococcus maricopensis]|uniref:Metalloenzyme n=1 Tax=Deinococcus maricopensis (strain DSM 21211 / LMG 22137 / NRRL B-23946 / LB-34) TaxID=709986 RepID=E8U4M0_DEIML|nr:metalloprotein [Deinococcus maricopensis]ADV68885.1 metalloenzyme [Deinococcus maricopensis DSM 21211]
MTGVVWLALDGVGHPQDAPTDSPWATDLPTLRPLLDAGLVLDATLGVEGLPQSATGQACWLTGQDAVRVMGGHFGPQPGPTLRALLDAESLPGRLARAGARVDLLNPYPPAYFAARDPAQGGRVHLAHGSFPHAFLHAGRPLNPPGLPSISPLLGLAFAEPHDATATPDDLRRLGEQVARAARDHDLLTADLWFSDALGHAGRDPTPPGLWRAARTYLQHLNALLEGLLHAGARVAISSDHGNFEDLHVKSHTVARVPFAASGLPLSLADGTAPATIVDGGRVLTRWFT